MNLNPILKLSTALITSSYKLNLTELRFVLLALIKYNEQKKSCFEINALEISGYYQLPLQQSYRFLESVVKTVKDKEFVVIDNEENKLPAQWFNDIHYQKGKASVILKLSNEILALIDDKQSHFLFIDGNDVARLKSFYSIRFYFYFMMLKEQKTKRLSLEQLRQMLVLTANYARFTNIKTRILEPAISEINEKTSITVSFEIEKEGTKIIALKFKIKDKVKSQTKTQRCSDTMELFE